MRHVQRACMDQCVSEQRDGRGDGDPCGDSPPSERLPGYSVQGLLAEILGVIGAQGSTIQQVEERLHHECRMGTGLRKLLDG